MAKGNKWNEEPEIPKSSQYSNRQTWGVTTLGLNSLSNRQQLVSCVVDIKRRAKQATFLVKSSRTWYCQMTFIL
ncbi:hypothetical protein N7449_011737 [Penicillium cf. viridicatum]|uniref:Uncharacterized protein n=1 Tax=Penicillium cf. viridicatum TaxID=2972119 RepID=A0A9W9IR70_9EURO|nr:hypothetical protein N7449_011737 [Penicillium cf. viridicatum]